MREHGLQEGSTIQHEIGRALQPLIGVEVDASVRDRDGATLSHQQGTLERVCELPWLRTDVLLIGVGREGSLRVRVGEVERVDTWSVTVLGREYASVAISLRSGSWLLVAEDFADAFS
jgi:hypothetical protein